MITLNVEPRVTKTWDQFLKENPAYSIALDGYVRGRPNYDSNGPRANFNHHEEVDRLGTRSTCEQVQIAIKQGLLDTFKLDGEPHLIADVNDCDQDVCAAYWLLQNHERIIGNKSEPLITRAISVVGLLDTTAGAYPLAPAMRVRRELAWIFLPYTTARTEGRIHNMSGTEMRNIVESVCDRMTKYSLGQGEKVELDTRYERLGGGQNWALIKEIGFDARSRLFNEGIGAFVSARDNGNSTYSYSIGKISPFVNFPILKLYDMLNEAEGISADSTDRWGGGDTIGGSPRMRGSKLAPKELELVVNDFLKKYNSKELVTV